MVNAAILSQYLNVLRGVTASCLHLLQGYGGNGQLGLGSTVSRYAPTQVGAASDWVYVSASYVFTCGLRSNGSTFCWGYNNAGQLGDGTVTQRTDPGQVQSSTTFSQITTSPYGSCGIPGPAPILTPLPAAPPLAPFPRGPACWGSNAKGQWGDGTTSGTSSYPGPDATSVWMRLSMSDASSCGIMAGTFSLYCWGADPGYGNLGLNATATQNYPTIVAGGGQWQAVFANDYHVSGGGASVWRCFVFRCPAFCALCPDDSILLCPAELRHQSGRNAALLGYACIPLPGLHRLMQRQPPYRGCALTPLARTHLHHLQAITPTARWATTAPPAARSPPQSLATPPGPACRVMASCRALLPPAPSRPVKACSAG